MFNTTTRLLAGFGYFCLKRENTLTVADVGLASSRHVAIELVRWYQLLGS